MEVKVGAERVVMKGDEVAMMLKRFEPPVFEGSIKHYNQWRNDYYRIVVPSVGKDVYF